MSSIRAVSSDLTLPLLWLHLKWPHFWSIKATRSLCCVLGNLTEWKMLLCYILSRDVKYAQIARIKCHYLGQSTLKGEKSIDLPWKENISHCKPCSNAATSLLLRTLPCRNDEVSLLNNLNSTCCSLLNSKVSLLNNLHGKTIQKL